MIKKVGDQWVLYSSDGKKRLGTYSSRSQAERREQQIQYFKHKDKGNG